jgi:hypothetical protein
MVEAKTGPALPDEAASLEDRTWPTDVHAGRWFVPPAPDQDLPRNADSTDDSMSATVTANCDQGMSNPSWTRKGFFRSSCQQLRARR